MKISLKNKVYQMFMLAPQGSDFNNEQQLKIALENGLGGVIFFTKNILTIEQTKKLISQVKQSSIIPPFIGVDQEGGRVERTENIFNGKKFLSARYQAQKGEVCVEKTTKDISVLIKSMGFNMNFAPVLDVNTNPKNPIIGERAYGTTVAEVQKYGLCAMQSYLDNGVIPVGKHFPGHGDADVDSHLELPVLKQVLKEIEENHIAPFKAAIEKGLPAIMVAHIYCPAFDKKVSVPASLSASVLKYLREVLGYTGLIISDDMQMGALQTIPAQDAIIQGINSGINLFLYRESTREIMDLIESSYRQIKEDKALIEKVDKSFEIIQSVKLRYCNFL